MMYQIKKFIRSLSTRILLLQIVITLLIFAVMFASAKLSFGLSSNSPQSPSYFVVDVYSFGYSIYFELYLGMALRNNIAIYEVIFYFAMAIVSTLFATFIVKLIRAFRAVVHYLASIISSK